jgi:hypothetical protein
MSRQTWKLVLVAAACAATQISLAPVPAQARERDDATVIAQWDAIAVRTIASENPVPIPASTLYFGFVSLAVYDAVVAIRGGYRPYLPQPPADRRASADAAVVTAAHDVLAHYFPASAANLAADRTAALAAIPDGYRKTAGQRAGATAAARLIAARADDGRNAAITFTAAPAPGVWRPTPDAFAPMAVAWLGFVRPLALRAPDQIPLAGPDALHSRAYARDFAEVRAYGAAQGSARSDAQTQTAMFWSANVVAQFHTALQDQITRRGVGLLPAARASALLGLASADTQIGCWRAKYEHAFWRPVTAIRLADTDGNPRTSPDPAWTPLALNPPYPDYVSGHACITGAATETFGHLFGSRSIDLDVTSPVTGTTRHYRSTAALDAETMNARIWLGLHFRRAMTDGNRLGHETARWIARHELGPAARD